MDSKEQTAFGGGLENKVYVDYTSHGTDTIIEGRFVPEAYARWISTVVTFLHVQEQLIDAELRTQFQSIQEDLRREIVAFQAELSAKTKQQREQFQPRDNQKEFDQLVFFRTLRQTNLSQNREFQIRINTIITNLALLFAMYFVSEDDRAEEMFKAVFENKIKALQQRLEFSTLQDYKEFVLIGGTNEVSDMISTMIEILLDGSVNYYIKLLELSERCNIIDLTVRDSVDSDKAIFFYHPDGREGADDERISLKRPHQPFTFKLTQKDRQGNSSEGLSYTHKRIQADGLETTFGISGNSVPRNPGIESRLTSRLINATEKDMVYYPEDDRDLLLAFAKLADIAYPHLQEIQGIVTTHQRVINISRRYESYGITFTNVQLPPHLPALPRMSSLLEFLDIEQNKYVRGLLSAELITYCNIFLHDCAKILISNLDTPLVFQINNLVVAGSIEFRHFYERQIMSRVGDDSTVYPDSVGLVSYSDTRLTEFFEKGPAAVNVEGLLASIRNRPDILREVKRINDYRSASDVETTTGIYTPSKI